MHFLFLLLVGKLTFVGGEYFGSRQDVIEGVEDTALGAITIKLNTPDVIGFMTWMKSLNVADHGDIPDDWFEEFWQRANACKLLSARKVCKGNKIYQVSVYCPVALYLKSVK